MVPVIHIILEFQKSASYKHFWNLIFRKTRKKTLLFLFPNGPWQGPLNPVFRGLIMFPEMFLSKNRQKVVNKLSKSRQKVVNKF